MRKALFFLGILNDADIDWLLANGLKREVLPGVCLIAEGKPIDSIFLVLDGRLSVSIAALENREVAQLMSGEIVGEMSFVDSNPPSASVGALERTFVLAIPKTRLRAKLDSDAMFASRFYPAIAVLPPDRLRTTRSPLG